MSQRFSGEFSPNSDKQAPAKGPAPKRRSKRAQKGRARANIMFFAAIPLVFRSFGNAPLDMAQDLIAAGLMLLGAWLTREGLEAQEAFEARAIARRPAIPRKIFASVAIGLAVSIATFAGSPFGALVYGVIAVALYLFAFGLDPLKDKVPEGFDSFQTSRVARAVDEAERHLEAMKLAIDDTKDRVLIGRVEQFQSTARDMFRTIEDDPRDLTSARKYLGVYLLGAKDAALKFSEYYQRTTDAQAKSDFTSLLDDLEANFLAKNQMLISDSRTELDIEIDVLRDRLSREGIKLN